MASANISSAAPKMRRDFMTASWGCRGLVDEAIRESAENLQLIRVGHEVVARLAEERQVRHDVVSDPALDVQAELVLRIVRNAGHGGVVAEEVKAEAAAHVRNDAAVLER